MWWGYSGDIWWYLGIHNGLTIIMEYIGIWLVNNFGKAITSIVNHPQFYYEGVQKHQNMAGFIIAELF